METQKEWLDYINKFQDRKRAKITSSGLTIWVLISAICTIAYNMYIHFEDIQKNYKTFIILSTFIENS